MKISRDVGMVKGFMDMPPYVTMVAPGASDLATAVDEAPPTQFRPSFGRGTPADAAIITTSWLTSHQCGMVS